MTRGKTTPRGEAIAVRTRVLAQALGQARVDYWAALLARPQLAAPIVHAVRLDVETGGWERRLGRLVAHARTLVRTRRRGDEIRYAKACRRAAEWLAGQDRGCDVANGITNAIALWAGRRLPGEHRWAGHRLYPARTQSQRWRQYWHAVDHGRHERERLRNEIVVVNEGLVITLCNRWIPWAEGHLSREDIQQAGREGLFRAADLFEPERGFRFSTYAGQWIRHRVFRLHQEGRSDVKAPTGVQMVALAISDLAERGERDPATIRAALRRRAAEKREAAIRLARTPAAQAKLRAARAKEPPTEDAIASALEYLASRTISMDARLGRSEEGRPQTLADLLPDASPLADEVIDLCRLEERLAAVDQERVTARLLQAVAGLDPRDRDLVRARYYRGRTLHSLAGERGTSARDLERHEQTILDRLRADVGITA